MILVVCSEDSFANIKKNDLPLHHYKAIDFVSVDFTLPEIDFDWILFTSKRGLDFFIEKIEQNYLEKFHIAAVGKKTAKAIEKKSISVDFIPKNYSVRHFFHEFSQKYSSAKGILLPTSDLSNNDLEYQFEQLDIPFCKIIVYRTIPHRSNLPSEFQSIVFASPSCFENFCRQETISLEGKRIIAIGPTTAQAIKEKGLSCLVPEKYTLEHAINYA